MNRYLMTDIDIRNNIPIRVLLVDDHKILREGLCGIFRYEEDMELVGDAEDGSQAVELAEKLRPHVVVMDVNMPVMNGIEATRILSKKCPEIKVIGLSMHNDQDVAAAMEKAGAVGYVAKDAPSDELLETIRQCCCCGSP